MKKSNPGKPQKKLEVKKRPVQKAKTESKEVPESSGPSAPPPIEELTSAEYYFDAYAHFGEHEKLLRDQVRTNTFRKAIHDHKKLIEGKVVLDLGCGTGILSMFAVRAGAARVIAVECANIFSQAERIIKANKMSDVITLIKGKIEEVELPVEKVDVIICDWLGFFLFQDSLIDSVIYARDKWLRPGGLILPDKASLFLLGLEDSDYSEKRSEFWSNVYGFNMSCVQELCLAEPLIDSCNPKQIATNHARIVSLDLNTAKSDQLHHFQAKFSLNAVRREAVHCFVGYFLVEFGPTGLSIDTSPQARYTHWRQTIFCLREPLLVNAGDSIEGAVEIRRNPSKARELDIFIAAHVVAPQDRPNPAGEQPTERKYRLQ